MAGAEDCSTNVRAFRASPLRQQHNTLNLSHSRIRRHKVTTSTVQSLRLSVAELDDCCSSRTEGLPSTSSCPMIGRKESSGMATPTLCCGKSLSSVRRSERTVLARLLCSHFSPSFVLDIGSRHIFMSGSQRCTTMTVDLQT